MRAERGTLRVCVCTRVLAQINYHAAWRRKFARVWPDVLL